MAAPGRWCGGGSGDAGQELHADVMLPCAKLRGNVGDGWTQPLWASISRSLRRDWTALACCERLTADDAAVHSCCMYCGCVHEQPGAWTQSAALATIVRQWIGVHCWTPIKQSTPITFQSKSMVCSEKAVRCCADSGSYWLWAGTACSC